MRELTLLPWSIGAFTVATAYNWSLPWLAEKGYTEKRPDGQESISEYVDNPHANAAFAMSLVPTIAVEWVDVALSKEVTMLGVVALTLSQLGLTGVVAADVDYDPTTHAWSFVTLVVSLIVYSLIRTRSCVEARVRWPLYSLMAISAGLFVTLVYRYHTYPDERGPTFYRIETAMLTALVAFTPVRLYLETRG